MYRKLTNRTRLSQEAASHIKALIRSEKLRAGDKLPNEMELAELFGVSRPTVREAVKTLVSQNVIEIVRGKGTFVAQNPGVARDPLGLDLVATRTLPQALMEARRILEPEVARLAAQRAKSSDIQKLERLVREMETAVVRDNTWMNVEMEFHGSIAAASQNPVIMRLMPVIVEAIVRTLRYAPRSREDHSAAYREHAAILAAIRERSPEKAFRAMQQHLRGSYRRTMAIGFNGKPRRPHETGSRSAR